jgi:hypothetical protein
MRPIGPGILLAQLIRVGVDDAALQIDVEEADDLGANVELDLELLTHWREVVEADDTPVASTDAESSHQWVITRFASPIRIRGQNGFALLLRQPSRNGAISP